MPLSNFQVSNPVLNSADLISFVSDFAGDGFFTCNVVTSLCMYLSLPLNISDGHEGYTIFHRTQTFWYLKCFTALKLSFLAVLDFGYKMTVKLRFGTVFRLNVRLEFPILGFQNLTAFNVK